jgi:hypothetical protein
MGGGDMIDWTKPIETTDGLKARVMGLLSLAMEPSPIKPDESGFEPMMVWVYRDGNWGWGNVFLVNNEGFRCDDRALFSARQEPFIRNVKVKREGWVNIYAVYKTEDEAKRACVDLDRNYHRFAKWEE